MKRNERRAGTVGQIRSYRDLIAWQKSMALCRNVYGATKAYPSDERFGLTRQTRRAAVSVPSNIAEGWGRGSRGDYLRFLSVARGSLCELETEILLAGDLAYLSRSETDVLLANVAECSRILNGLISSLESARNTG